MEGAGVVTTRAHVRTVVTEWGVAELFGKSMRERAEALIAIAHPARIRLVSDRGPLLRHHVHCRVVVLDDAVTRHERIDDQHVDFVVSDRLNKSLHDGLCDNAAKSLFARQ